MSFEKLREIMLVIGIGLFLTVALIIAFISTLNARKGGQTVIAVQDVLIKGFQKSDTVRNRSTIATFAEDLNGKQVGDLKIEKDKIFVLNVDGGTQVQSGSIKLTQNTTATGTSGTTSTDVDFPTDLQANTAANGKLFIAFIPSQVIKHASAKDTPAYAILTKDRFELNIDATVPVDASSDKKAVKQDNFKDYNEGLRGFMSSGYMSFWGFDKDEAKSYRDKFFPAGIVVEGHTGVYGIAIEMAVN